MIILNRNVYKLAYLEERERERERCKGGAGLLEMGMLKEDQTRTITS